MSNATVTQMRNANRATSTLADTVTRFLRRDFAPTTLTAYGKTLAVLIERLGADTPVDRISTEQLEDLLAATWGQTGPKTYNRHLAAVSSFFTWAAERGSVAHNPARMVESRKVRRLTEDAKRERPIPAPLLEELWHLRDLPVRDKALWQLAYETWGRADELLGLNVEDLDLANNERLVTGKGGNRETLWWSTRSARLLPKIISGRTAGPLFLANRRPWTPQPAADIDPATGRARLGYRQAETLFKQAGQRLDPDGAAWTLHRLRHSGIAHAAETGMNIALLRAKSRHSSLRSLEVYANPSAQSIRAMTDALDPEAGRR